MINVASLRKKTIGDAFQTLAVELRVEVVIQPALMGVNKNDWKAFVKIPLQLEEVDSREHLTVEDFTKMLCEQMDATCRSDEQFLYFDLRDPDAESSTPEKGGSVDKLKER